MLRIGQKFVVTLLVLLQVLQTASGIGLVTQSGARLAVPTPASQFPLSIDSSGRFLKDALGRPFLLNGEAAWELEVQCTDAQIDTYLANRALKGINAILVETFEANFSDQTPKWKSANGDIPFTTTNSTSTTSWTSPVEAYWAHFDHLINKAKSLGIVVGVFPAYFGFSGSSEGWSASVALASDADLQTYGAWLANRYTQGNIVWILGGDYAGDTTLRNKQWNVAIGIRSVNSSAIIAGHPARTDSDGYSVWGPGGQNYTGWNLNTIYAAPDEIVSEAATAWGRSGPVPSFNVEAYYENEHSMTSNDLAVQIAQSYLSGQIGYFNGIAPLWNFGSGGVGATGALSAYLETPSAEMMRHMSNLMRSVHWERLRPKTDTSLVTTSLGTGVAATAPAIDSSGLWALIEKNNSSAITVNLAALSGPLNARWYDPTNGTYVATAECPTSCTNSGTQSFAHPGNNSVGGTVRILDLRVN